jgi:hypothetical protein
MKNIKINISTLWLPRSYIGASIGLAMPQFKNVAAKVLKY